MPNRKTFDQKEKYDHSGHSAAHAEPADLKAPLSDQGRASPAATTDGSDVSQRKRSGSPRKRNSHSIN